MSVACVPQRVFNVYHHLADGTLPPDLWNDAAELAVIVHLVVHHPVQAAFERLQTCVQSTTGSTGR